MGVSKVIYGGTTLIDLTADTIKKEHLLKGYTAHGADGEPLTGECEYNANTNDGTATDAEILSGKVAYVKGNKIIGKMTNHNTVNGTISTKSGTYSILQGYHDGSGKVGIDSTEQAKLIPSNIRQGVTILGVEGNMSTTEGANAQAKEVTPTTDTQVVLPGEGYNFLSQVTVKPIPYEETDNNAGGKTVTIG